MLDIEDLNIEQIIRQAFKDFGGHPQVPLCICIS